MFTNMHAYTLLCATQDYVLCQNWIPWLTACTRRLNSTEQDGPQAGLTVARAAGRPNSLLSRNGAIGSSELIEPPTIYQPTDNGTPESRRVSPALKLPGSIPTLPPRQLDASSLMSRQVVQSKIQSSMCHPYGLILYCNRHRIPHATLKNSQAPSDILSITVTEMP